MKVKNYYLNVDNDKIWYLSIELEDDDSIPENFINKDYALSNDPQILDITHLNYTPAKLSVWNGSDFIAPEGEEHRPPSGQECENGCVSFAFLKDNVYYGMTSYCLGPEPNDVSIAALSSNPVITFEVEEL